jgi:hypothetical protein
VRKTDVVEVLQRLCYAECAGYRALMFATEGVRAYDISYVLV